MQCGNAVHMMSSAVIAAEPEQEPEQTQSIAVSETEEKETAVPSANETEGTSETAEEKPTESKITEPSGTSGTSETESSEPTGTESSGSERNDDKAPVERADESTAPEKDVPAETAKQKPKKEIVTEKYADLTFSYDDSINRLTFSGK
nr:hypothetical protein [Saccharofermentans sp.]